MMDIPVIPDCDLGDDPTDTLSYRSDQTHTTQAGGNASPTKTKLSKPARKLRSIKGPASNTPQIKKRLRDVEKHAVELREDRSKKKHGVSQLKGIEEINEWADSMMRDLLALIVDKHIGAAVASSTKIRLVKQIGDIFVRQRKKSFKQFAQVCAEKRALQKKFLKK